MIQTAISRYLHKHGFEAFTPKAVLFDMDGVLFDSMPFHARSWAQVCSEHGLEMSPEEAYLHEGRTGEDTIQILSRRLRGREATAAEVEEIYAGKCRLFNACPEAPVMPGAARVLRRVREAGLEIAVVTGSGQRSLLDRLQTCYPGYFTPGRVVSSKDVRRGKPSPEPYLLGLERVGLRPWEAIVVENAPLGVEAAVAAQIFTVAVNTGPIPDSALLEKGADLLFPSMDALAEAFWL